VLARIKNQIHDEEKIRKADFVIVNTNIEDTKKQVSVIHKKLLKLAQQIV